MQPDIQVNGIADVQKALRSVSADLPRDLRRINKEAADLVREGARSRAPRRTGKLRDSIASRAEQRGASLKGGGARVPYFGFIDFGGSVGRNNSVKRPFIRRGRIIYPAVNDKRDQIIDTYGRNLNQLLRGAGLQN